MIWGILSLILLIVVIGLVIWLLVRSDSCPKKGKLGDPCSASIDCNGGLVCTSGSGSNLTNTASTTTSRTCQVAFGETCSASSDCAAGQSCINNVCQQALGTLNKSCPCATGFTCVNNVCKAVVGQTCNADSDCATGMCMNNVCVAQSSGPTCCSSYSSGCNTSDYDGSSYSRHKRSYSDSSSYSKHRRSYSNSSLNSLSNTRDSGSYVYYTCSDSDCSKSKYYSSSDKHHSYDSSLSEPSKCYSYDSYSDKHHSYDSSYPSKYNSYDSYSSKSNSSSCSPYPYRKSSLECSSYDKYVKRGVYVTNEQNQDQTLFTSIEQPIIDIVKTDKIYLLLDNGNIAINNGMSNTIYYTNKKVERMVRFGNQIVGIKKGKLYYGTKSNANSWNWENLNNYPQDALFINSTNSGNNLEVLTCRGKAYLYTYGNNWKDANTTDVRKTHDLRFYGKDISRYIDIDERNNFGKTNDGQKVKHIKSAGFYPTNTLVSVLEDDCFTHVRIIDNKAYFLFEQ